MVACREVDGGVDWAKVRGEINTGLDDVGRQMEPVNPDTWGLEPEHIADQERLIKRGGNVGAAPGEGAPATT